MYGNGTFVEQSHAHDLAKGRFRDLAMTVEGFNVLESLFLDADAVPLDNDDLIYGCIYALQSLCITGMLVGVKGSPEQMQRRVQHLKRYEWREMPLQINEANNNNDQTAMMQRLKFESDQTAGIQLLAQLGMKRTTQGAMDLLVTLGVWTLHEDLNLLRSGFPVTFPPRELQLAKDAAESTRDVDAMLGIRKDLTHHKVYTIDSVSTSEVDDGLSVEELSDGRLKFWIHIADADRWAPRDSEAFQIALGRTTTHYLPTGAIPMFPPR
jgi:exoribonuclease-2